MKRIALLVTCISLTLCALAQTQQGYVRTIGKPGKKGVALSGVTVRAKGSHNAVVSKSNGRFSMKMKGLKNGDAYSLQQVQKNGYELNDAGTIGRQYAFSSTVPLTIVMVSTAQLQADKQRIENNAYAVAEKNYKAKMAKLEKQLNENTITAEEYRAALQELQDSFEKYQSLIESLADHYAHTDYDMLDENEAEINTLIENGELEKADSLINTLFDPIDVLKRNKEALERLDQTIADAQGIIDQANADLASVLKQQEKDAEYLYQLYTIALAQFDNERAAKYIQTRAALDTTNLEWLKEAGFFIEEYLADYPLAMEYFQRCLNQAIKLYGEQNELTARYCDCVGDVYRRLGDYTMAINFFQRALTIREQVFSIDHPNVANSYNNISAVYIDQGHYTDVLEFLQKALEIREQVYGTNHPDVAQSYNNLGEFYRRLGDYAKGLEFLQKALAIREQVFGPINRHVAASYNNIGGAYMYQGDYAKGLEFLQKALAIREQVFGMNHPDVAQSYDNIGQLYEKLHDYAKSLEFHQKALIIRERNFGGVHPDVARSYNNIGAVLFSRGDYSTGMEYFEKALAIRERYFGTSHPDVAASYNNIGAYYFRLGDYTHALEYCKKLLAMPEEYLGPNLQSVKDNYEHCQYQLAYQQAFANGDYSQALEYCNNLLAMQTQYSNAQSIKTNSYLCKYLLALESGTTKGFFNDHCIIETVVDGDSPAQQQGMSGEYILLEMNDWSEKSTKSIFNSIEALSGKPKDIVVLKDGVITNYHFENAIGAKFGFKQITKEERKQINQLYKQWKKDQKN